MLVVLLEVAVLLALIVVNGFLAMSETAVVTARRGRLERRAEQGEAGARRAAALKEEPTHFLSAVQVGITLVGILAGALGGSRLARHLEGPLAAIGWLAPWADTVALVVTVAAVTYLSLIVGELVPKRIALSAPERVASRVARPMQRLARLSAPLVALLTASTNLVARLIGVREREESEVTEGEIRRLIAQGARAGVVQAAEEDILERVFYLGDRQVSAVMTPRPDVRCLDVAAPRDAMLAALEEAPDEHLLVCRGGVDDVVGVVHTAGLLSRCLRGEPLDPARLAHEALRVSAAMPVLELLQRFRQSALPLAVVHDDADRLLGVVTLDDILQDLVQNIPRKVGPRASDVVHLEDDTWLLDGGVPIDAAERALGTKILPSSAPRRGRTLHEVLTERLGRRATEGDRLSLGGYDFEVVDMDGRHVDRVRVTRGRE